MPLQIECENGHKLVCPESLAGSSVICPQCGSRVDVSARNVAKGGRAFSQAAQSSLSGMHRVDATAVQAESGESNTDEISFSCPNGHRLAGPRSLQGRAGECPKCGVRFRVPVDGLEKEPEAESAEDEISLEGIEEIDLAPPAPPQTSTDETEHSDALAASAQSTRRSLLEHFAELWKEREHGGRIELLLERGETIAPDWWSPGKSTEDFGVFATQTDQGTYEIHAILWSHILRITIHGLRQLPGGVFDV